MCKKRDRGRQAVERDRERKNEGWMEGGGRERVEQVLQLNYKVFHDLWVEP